MLPRPGGIADTALVLRAFAPTFALVSLLVTGCAACGVKAPNYDYASEPDPRKGEYVLGVGDDLTITVWQNDALSTDATIRPDGTITMPLIGDMHASGETPSNLKQIILERAKDYVKIKPDEVTVAVRGANSYRFTVSGEITRPGIITSEYYVTVAEAVALAGGFTRFAKRNEMVLMRRPPKSGDVRHIPLAYDLLATGEHPEMNLVLIAGDSLYVP
jgi:polysaccharide export outer membrane protein